MTIDLKISPEIEARVLVAVQDALCGDEMLIAIRQTDANVRTGYWENGYAVAWKSLSRSEKYGQCGTHIVKLNSRDESMLVWGHYDLSEEQALEDQKTRR